MTQVALIGFPVSAALTAVLKTVDRELFDLKMCLDSNTSIEDTLDVLEFIVRPGLVHGNDAELVKLAVAAPYRMRIVYLPDVRGFWVVSSTVSPDLGLGFDLEHWSTVAQHFKNFLRYTLKVDDAAEIAEEVKLKVSTLS